MKDIKHIKWDFFSVTWDMPQGLGLGGGAGGVQTSDFLNVIMWHIKLKGMSSRLGYIEKNNNLGSN